MTRLEVIDKLSSAQTKLMTRLDALESTLDKAFKEDVITKPVEEEAVLAQHFDRSLSMAAPPRFFRERSIDPL